MAPRQRLKLCYGTFYGTLVKPCQRQISRASRVLFAAFRHMTIARSDMTGWKR